jgi:CheY-specific phosphatase CheX
MDNNRNQIIIEFKGKITESNIKLLRHSILTNQDIPNKEKMKNYSISLKKIEFENNVESLIHLVNNLNRLITHQKVTSICFIDYTTELFAILKKATKDTSINLFRNSNVANIFLNPQSFKKGTSVLVYDENEENSKKLFTVLYKYDYKLVRAKDVQEFLAGINGDSYNAVVTRSALNEKAKSPKNSLTLSKKLIVNLPIFMNKAAETLVSFTGLEAQKVAHSIRDFDTTLDDDSISAVMQFKGDLEGFFTLVFPKDIAITALESLLGEKVKESDVATLKDGVGEFCNIITGSTKTAFDEKGIKIFFNLPKTYNSLKDTQKFIGTHNGVWMDMELADKPFYMFITK